MHNLKKIFVASTLLFLVVLNLFWVKNFAQEARTKNPIQLKIPGVIVGGQKANTRLESADKWVFDGNLSIDDDILYSWQGVDLNLKYKQTPAKSGGWLKVYSENITDANLLAETGLDNYPFKLSAIADKLKVGENNLQFVYVNSFTKIEYLPVSFKFQFKKESSNPQIEILKPQQGAVFMNGVEQEILLNIKNFQLTNSPTNKPNTGKINLFYNEVKDANFLGKFSSAKTTPEGDLELALSSKDLDFSKVPDNQETKLIFVLSDTQDNLLPNFQSEVTVVSNYQGSLNVGLPTISIIEPKKNRSDLTVKNDDKFIVQINNFEILSQRPTTSSIENDPKKGFLQIIVISGDSRQPIQPIWGKTEFSLNEIGYSDSKEGQKTVKVQLVDQNFEILKPEASDSIDIFYEPDKSDLENKKVDVQTDTWRIVIISLTVLLIVGGIAVLITRG